MVFLFSDISADWDPLYRILFLFVTEHTIYLIKIVVCTNISDIHPDVERDLLIEGNHAIK